MMTAANELLRAVCARLSGSPELIALIGADGIHDRLIARRPTPYLVIGEIETRDNSTSTEESEEHLFAIAVWTEADGSRICNEIAGIARALLDDAQLGLDSHALVNLRHLSTRVRREPKSRHYMAELRFRAVTE